MAHERLAEAWRSYLRSLVRWPADLCPGRQQQESPRLPKRLHMRADPPRGSDAERAAALQRIEDVCQELSGHMTWGEMLRFFADNKDMWVILLGPIILLWLVGAIVLDTVRWVPRGFAGPGR